MKNPLYSPGSAIKYEIHLTENLVEYMYCFLMEILLRSEIVVIFHESMH